MKFMVTWQIHAESLMDVLKVWTSLTPEQRVDAGDGVRIVGRWHYSANGSGVAIVEANDAAALYRYLGRWSPYMSLQVAPVLDDEESVAVSKETLAGQGA